MDPRIECVPHTDFGRGGDTSERAVGGAVMYGGAVEGSVPLSAHHSVSPAVSDTGHPSMCSRNFEPAETGKQSSVFRKLPKSVRRVAVQCLSQLGYRGKVLLL